MKKIHNLGKEIEEQVKLRTAFLRRDITVTVLAGLLIKSTDDRYNVSKETMEVLSDNHLVSPEGPIDSLVLKVVIEMRDMAVEIPELRRFEFE